MIVAPKKGLFLLFKPYLGGFVLYIRLKESFKSLKIWFKYFVKFNFSPQIKKILRGLFVHCKVPCDGR